MQVHYFAGRVDWFKLFDIKHDLNQATKIKESMSFQSFL